LFVYRVDDDAPCRRRSRTEDDMTQIASIIRGARLLVLGTALVTALALPSAAFADTTPGPTIPPAVSRDATITITSATVTARLIVSVRVDYVCQPFLSFDWETGEWIQSTAGLIEEGQAIVIQAQGRTIASGSGAFNGTVTCDGSTVNHVTIPVIASTAPWRTGSAVVAASLFAVDASFHDGDYASTGAIAMKIVK
jgi:hypothetical protein